MHPKFCAFVVGLFSLLCSSLHAANLKVNLAPTQAVSAGAQWRVDGGTWRNSGVTIKNLSNGSHTVTFKAVSGWLAPAPQIVTLTAGTTTLSGTYARPASLKVNLPPAGGQWRVDGSSWKASGTTATGLTPGSHNVEYLALTGYSNPAAETVNLTAGQTTTLSRSYVQLAHISITLQPGTGQWRADGGPWQASGATLATLPGEYILEYSALTDYDSPESETVTVAAGGTFSATRSYVSTKPTLQVNLTPNTGQWRVDGGTWRASGAMVADLAAGNHTIDYSDIGGTFDPIPSETISLALRDHAVVTRSYPPKPPASVEVSLHPNGLGAQWRINGGAWLNVGSIVNNLAYGVPHTVEFSPALGYVAPAPQTFTLSSGEHRILTGTYTPLASVFVTLNPSWLGAQWRIDGGEWQSPGSGAYNLAYDVPHTVEFSSALGYVAPEPQTFTLTSGEYRTITATYTPLGSLYINLTPDFARWRVDGGPWNASGASVYNLTLGSHTIEYSTHEGYLTPAAETTTVSGYESLTRTYAVDPTFSVNYSLASVSVTLDPGFAEWRLDGGAWHTSGATLYNLPVGPHTLEYAVVDDYIEPATETVTLAAGYNPTHYASYISIDPAQLTITTNPASGQWRLYRYQWPASGAWRASGDTASGLNPGQYTIEYSPVTGYDEPGLTFVNLLPNDTQALTAAYSPRMFRYKITLVPSTGRYRLNGGAWLTSGSTTMGHSPGPYLVEFEPEPGYVTPAPVTVTFEAGGNEHLTFTYTPL